MCVLKLLYVIKLIHLNTNMDLEIFLQGIVALVTGGASGLGRGTVERFIKQGAKAVIADLPASKGKTVAEELGENAIFAPMDVCITFSIVIVLLSFLILSCANCIIYSFLIILFLYYYIIS